MKKNLEYQDNNKPKAPDELLKATALLYFKEALENQQYEQCPAFIQTAKRFGARQSEVRKVIAQHTNRGRADRRNEANEQYGGRLRFK